MDTSATNTPVRLRLLTFNMQVGIHTRGYHDYITRSWQHLLPNRGRATRLDLMCDTFTHFDLVALQEVDGGSFRSSNINHVEYLAAQSKFPWARQQLNRDFGRIAKHSNGLLSRLAISHVDNHRLPGPKGRGAMHVRFGEGPEALHLFVLHLALGARTQNQQLDYLASHIEPLKNVIVMGDLNCTSEKLQAHSRFSRALKFSPGRGVASYPSWQPRRALDHILVSAPLELTNLHPLPALFSDHLPLAADLQLPAACARSIAIASLGGTTPDSLR
ncbi:endonuclease/exonuclease/phosphatase family protein [Kushneria aurantia]|uniref:Endonuclease/exonuclease/phosphatase family protein n=1 Tax=Kushneria aurantia TaxID=504092 RepID=A0ABV6G1Z5_9GAMM|nr:endonuclease/exonuclease/phosphatase family protein [Kushneria aurantia]